MEGNSWWNGRIINPAEFTPSDVAFFSYNGKIEWSNEGDSLNYRYIFKKCSPLSAIVSRKADMLANGRIKIVNRNTQNEVRGQYKEWIDLLNKPNFAQTGADFIAQLYTFMMMRGFCYALPMYPAGFTDRPSSLWLLPPWHVLVTPLPKPMYQVVPDEEIREVRFTWQGHTTTFKEKDLILFQDTGSPHVNELTWLRESRIVGLQDAILNLIGSHESRNVLMRSRGALGILSNENKDEFGSKSIAPEDKEALQDDYRKYGLRKDQWQLIISNAALKWQPMAMDVKKLMLHEEHAADVNEICDTMNYQRELMASEKGTTFANKEEAKKSVYQDAIIPESIRLFQQLNNGLKTAANNIEIQIDFSHVECLQESVADAAAGRKATNEALLIEWVAGKITLNDWNEELNLDKLTGEQFDMYKPQYDKWCRDNGYTETAVPYTASQEINNLENQNANAA